MANGQEENGRSSKNRDGTLAQLGKVLSPIIEASEGLSPGPRYTILCLSIVTVILGILGLAGAPMPAELIALIFVLAIAGLVFSLLSEVHRWYGPAPREPEETPEEGAGASQAETLEEITDPLETYCRRLCDECDQIQLQALTRKIAAEPEAFNLRLSHVYVPLDVRGGPPQERGEGAMPARDDEGERTDRWPVAAAAAHYERLVLLGEQGSGKSTFAHHLAACLAGDYAGSREINADALAADWPHRRVLPLFLPLREYAAGGLMDGTGLWGFLRGRLEAMEEENEAMHGLRRQIEGRLGDANGVLLILDGYDEVPNAARKREMLRDALRVFADAHPDCRMLITARPYAYEREEWRLPGFDVRTLEELSEEQIDGFIDKWFAQVGKRDTRVGSETAARYAREVKGAVETNEGVAELAPRPLLLTLMVSLHWWRGGGLLPDRRHELYEEAVKLLLDLWQRPKMVGGEREEGGIFQRLGISLEGLRRALETVAYEAQGDVDLESGEANIPLSSLAGQLVAESDRRDCFPEAAAYVTNRAGILIERVPEEEYAFPHRSFQEYMAACHLAHDRPRTLIQHLREDDQRWREVALLAVARATASHGYYLWDLIEEAVSCGDAPSEEDYLVILRVAQALLETGQQGRVPDDEAQASLERLREHLQRLCSKGALPPLERADAGRALARLGDRRPGVGRRGDGLPDILWQEVPAGTLMMGSSEDDSDAISREVGPGGEPFPVEVGAFRVSAYPITYEQFAPFVEHGQEGYQNPQWWTKSGVAWREGRTQPDNWDWGRERHGNEPVVYVTWYEAHAYCAWLTEVLGGKGEKFRLPTEAEWEWMARGPDGSKWPWGDEWEDGLCNSSESEIGQPSAVGLFPAGISEWLAKEGAEVHDLAGNVWEWTRSLWGSDLMEPEYGYPYDPDDGRENVEADNDILRVVRGGAWGSNSRLCRASVRVGDDPANSYGSVGFRVVCLSPRP